MTPQQLIDLPGYGKAQQQLIKDGQWNENAGLPMKRYRVTVYYKLMSDERDTITVDAVSEEHALEVATSEIEDDADVVVGSADACDAVCLEDDE